MTAAAQLVQALRARGVNLEREGDRLRVRPASALSTDELEALRQVKREVLRLLQTEPALWVHPPDPPSERPNEVQRKPAHHVAEALPFLRMPLDVFARVGASLEVRVPWLDVTLWMVPTDRDVAWLMAEGVRRGRIWTATELMQFMAIGDRTPEKVKTVTHAKLGLDGEITEVRAPFPGRRERG